MLELIRRIVRLRREVLGINARNMDFIYRLNPRKNFPNVDDKLVAKGIMAKNGIPVPRTLAVFAGQMDLADVEKAIPDAEGFAVKPAQGAGGRGILILRKDESGRLVRTTPDGDVAVGVLDLRTHLSYILAGVFSLEKLTDRAFFEELLEPHDVFSSVSSGGMPDMRVIVHRGSPTMAMARIPTAGSGGRANLHQGALGLGIDISSGRTTHGLVGNRVVDSHPDHGGRLSPIVIPGWDRILEICTCAAGCVGLGYVGVDIAIDRRLGPVVIELNARPGLNIQLANMHGLAGELYGSAVS